MLYLKFAAGRIKEYVGIWHKPDDSPVFCGLFMIVNEFG